MLGLSNDCLNPMKNSFFVPTKEHRASFLYLINALTLFVLSAGLTLAVFLSLSRVPLFSADPFEAILSQAWLIAGFSTLVAFGTLTVLWRRSRVASDYQWGDADRHLGTILVVMGMIGGYGLFTFHYARAQGQVGATLTHQFITAWGRSDLPSPMDGKIAFDDQGRATWAAKPAQCPRARVQWEHLDATWMPQKSGGMVVVGALEATMLRSLWFHGCLSDTDYISARMNLTRRAIKARRRLSYENALVVWDWPPKTWQQIQSPLFRRIPLSQKTWCEDQATRAGQFNLVTTQHCATLPHAQESVQPVTSPPSVD